MSLYDVVERTLSSLCSFVGYFAITMCKFGGGDCSVGRVLALKIWESELIFKKACVKIKASCVAHLLSWCGGRQVCGPLDSQPHLLGKFQASERSRLKNNQMKTQDGQCLSRVPKVVPWLSHEHIYRERRRGRRVFGIFFLFYISV